MFAFDFTTSDLLKQGYFREAGRSTVCHQMIEVPQRGSGLWGIHDLWVAGSKWGDTCSFRREPLPKDVFQTWAVTWIDNPPRRRTRLRCWWAVRGYRWALHPWNPAAASVRLYNLLVQAKCSLQLNTPFGVINIPGAFPITVIPAWAQVDRVPSVGMCLREQECWRHEHASSDFGPHVL